MKLHCIPLLLGLLLAISGNPVQATEKLSAQEVLEQAKQFVEERKACFLSHGDFTTRLRFCRKAYMSKILMVANQGYGKPQLGRFLLCLRVCPMELAVCKGDLDLELRDTPCEGVEFQCVKQCFIDYYW